MTAIDKMIDRVLNPETKPDSHNLIRDTIRMSTAVRMSMKTQDVKKRKASTDSTDNVMKRLKISIDSKTVN